MDLKEEGTGSKAFKVSSRREVTQAHTDTSVPEVKSQNAKNQMPSWKTSRDSCL
jgi:hypothetical protein